MKHKCAQCEQSQIIDMLKGRSGLRCMKTGRVIVTFPTGREAAMEAINAPMWCKSDGQFP